MLTKSVRKAVFYVQQGRKKEDRHHETSGLARKTQASIGNLPLESTQTPPPLALPYPERPVFHRENRYTPWWYPVHIRVFAPALHIARVRPRRDESTARAVHDALPPPSEPLFQPTSAAQPKQKRRGKMNARQRVEVARCVYQACLLCVKKTPSTVARTSLNLMHVRTANPYAAELIDLSLAGLCFVRKRDKTPRNRYHTTMIFT